MLIIFAHGAIMYGLPGLCGALAALLTSVVGCRRAGHAFACTAAVGICLCLQYTGLLVLGGLLTGQWPATLPPAGIAYGLAWFAIPALFTSLPVIVVAYTATAVLTRHWRTTSRPGRQPSA